MANTLKNLLHTQLSTDSASLYTCPGGTKTIVIGMSAANVLSNASQVSSQATIKDVISLTAAEYANLSSVDANTLYIVI